MANTTYSYVKKFELDDTILPDVWCIIRLDGRGFSNFTRIHNFRKPNEPRGLALMNAAAAHTMSVFQDLVLGYGHSDEFSFLLKLDSNLYNRRRQKLLSAITSVFSSAYCIYWPKFFKCPLKAVPSFDGRIVLYPTFRHVRDYYSWRHADCHINNQYNSCFWCLVSKGKSESEAYTWLKGTQKSEKNEYMFQECGLNYNSMPSMFRKGSTLVRVVDVGDTVDSSDVYEFDDEGTISLFIKPKEVEHWSQVVSSVANPFKTFWDVFNENNIVLDDVGLYKLSSAECMVYWLWAETIKWSGSCFQMGTEGLSTIPHSLSTVFSNYGQVENAMDKSRHESDGNNNEEDDPNTTVRESLYTYRSSIKYVRRSASAPNRILDPFNKEARQAEERHHGRPLHEILHTHCRKSLFSNNTRQLDLKGFVNLLFVVLVVINFRMVIYNLRKYGLMLQFPSGIKQLLEKSPLLHCSIKIHIPLVFAWAIERFIAPLSTKPLSIPVVLLQGLNLAIVTYYPYLVVVHHDTEPAPSAVMLATSVVWALKIYSFHHVCLDYRRAVYNGDDLLEVCKTRMEARAASRYPDCIQFFSFYRFIIMPTVCFQFYYPTTRRVHWFCILRYFCSFCFLLAVARVIADQYIVMTVTKTFTMEEFKSANFSTVAYHIIDRMLLLSIPILCCWLIMFTLVFHHWCNFLAEITLFGDRRFYGDWWNAACFGEYWRKWNLPIHQFIVRHISKPLYSLGIPWGVTTIVVFIISAALHEYLISVPLGLGWTGYVFWAMMGQIPLLIFTRMECIRNNKTIGNVMFWCLFCFTGQPLGVLLYWYLWGVKQGSFV